MFFCGRKQEKAAANRALKMVRMGETEGNTVVFQGAPGAGKTSLIRHLKEQFRSEHCDVAHLIGAKLDQPEIALYEVLEQIEPALAEKLKGSHTSTVQGQLGIGGSGGGMSDSKTTLPIVIPTVRQLMGLRTDPNKPLVLFMDEAQNVRADEDNGRSSVLEELHQGGIGCVFLIAGGLSNTEKVLDDRGISRPADGHVITLQPLSREEVLDAVELFLHNRIFAIDRDDTDTTALHALIVNESMGWPQHLNNALRSLGEELIRTQGRLSACDLDAVQQNSQARRNEYYNSRTHSIPNKVLAELVTTVPKNKGVDALEIIKAIHRAYQTEPMLEENWPKKDVFHNLVHKGVLQDDGNKKLIIPIPSMYDYIKENA